MNNNTSNSNSSLRKCKWCDKPLHGGRLSRTYCNDACKQAAYYQRRKQPFHNKTVTEDHERYVTGHEPRTVTKPSSTTNEPLQIRPETTFNNQSNNHFTMGNNHKAIRTTGPASQKNAAPEAGISVMGMGIDREFITSLLESLPEAQQRDLSLMLMKTVLERHPDLLRQLVEMTQDNGRIESVTDESAMDDEHTVEEEDGDDEGYEQHEEDGLDEDENENDDDPSEHADEDDLPDDDDDLDAEASDEENADEDENLEEENRNDDEHDSSTYTGLETGANEQSLHSHSGLEALVHTSAEHIQSNADSNARRLLSSSPSVTSHEQAEEKEDIPVFGLGGERHEHGAHRSGYSDRFNNRNKEHEQRSFQAASSLQADVTGPHENDILLRQQNDNRHEPLGGYLGRFTSARIKRGMSVWEGLSVSVPVFMEEHVVRYATEHMIGIQSAGDEGGRLVTLHILFHRSQHRRAICRLLDLVLEAEEGLLSEADFKPDGSFLAHQGADEENEVNDTVEGWEEDDTTGPIDYECYGSGTSNIFAAYSSAAHLSAQNAPTHHSTNTVLQILGIG